MEQIHHSHAADIWRVVVGPLDNNVYILRCAETGDAALVDAAAEPDRLASLIAPYAPTVIVTTHGHFDHVGAAAELQATGMQFRLHPDDGFLVDLEIDQPLTPGTWKLGALDVEVIHTPGHTPGSVCFLVDGVLLTGDTLFPGGPGATRFPYSDFDQIIDSIERRLFPLGPEIRFFPGHGAPSTIGEEQPHLEEWRARRW